MSHTKGPWFDKNQSNGFYISDVYKWTNENDKESLANANLIAAAPEMLLALEQAILEFKSINNNEAYRKEFSFQNSETVCSIEKLIKKAKGEL